MTITELPHKLYHHLVYERRGSERIYGRRTFFRTLLFYFGERNGNPNSWILFYYYNGYFQQEDQHQEDHTTCISLRTTITFEQHTLALLISKTNLYETQPQRLLLSFLYSVLFRTYEIYGIPQHFVVSQNETVEASTFSTRGNSIVHYYVVIPENCKCQNARNVA